MDSLQNLLAKRIPQEPPEVKIIKDFVHEKFDESVGVLVREREIIITVRSAAVSGSLRSYLLELSNLCNTAKRLLLRIGTVVN